jgi:hypothetical protein
VTAMNLDQATSLLVAVAVTVLRPGDAKLRRALEVVVDHQSDPAITPRQLQALVKWRTE